MNNSSRTMSPEYRKRLHRYYLECALSEGSKTVLFLAFFLSQGLGKEFLASLLFMIPLRNVGGGLHCKHYISCLLASLALLCGHVYLGIYCPVNLYVKVGSILLCGVIAYLLVPVTSDNRPAATAQQARSCKLNTCIILGISATLMCFLPDNVYMNVGYWTIIIHTLQLIVAYHLKEVRKNV